MRKKDRKKAQKKKKTRASRTVETITGVEEQPESVEEKPETVERIEEEPYRSATHDPNCGLCNATISGGERLYLVKNSVTRTSRHVIAEETSEAIEKTGWSPDEILYAMIVKMNASRPMREETKARLKELGAEKREERKRSDVEIARRREQLDLIEEVTLDAKVEGRAKLRALTDRSGSRTEKKEEVSMAARTSTVKKTKTEPKISRKEPGAFVGSLGLSIFGKSVASVVRWMGKNNFSYEQCLNALKHKNVSPLPRERYLKHLLSWGKEGIRGAPAELTSDEMMVLHNAKNNGPSKTKTNGASKTATRTVSKAKNRSASKKRKK